MKPRNPLNKERPLSRQKSLKASKESHKIIKNAPLQISQSRVIYSAPQRVINTTSPQNFNNVIRHTSNEQPTAPSEVSPAARLASTERTTPNRKEKSSWSKGDDDMMRMLDNGVQMSQFPGILLPEPETLPPTASVNFSPTQSNIFSPITWPATPIDTFSEIFSPGTRTRETLQQKRIGMFSPVLGPQSQTVLSYNDAWPENNAFAQPSEFLSPEVGLSPSEFLSPEFGLPPSEFLSPEVGLPPSPPSPPNQFNSFNGG